jgi:hypothetical protein
MTFTKHSIFMTIFATHFLLPVSEHYFCMKVNIQSLSLSREKNKMFNCGGRVEGRRMEDGGDGWENGEGVLHLLRVECIAMLIVCESVGDRQAEVHLIQRLRHPLFFSLILIPTCVL